MILSDSLSALQAMHNLKYDHPILIKIHELYSRLIQEEREIVHVWVPGHVGIRGSYATDSAAKDTLDGDISDEFLPIPILNLVRITIFFSSGNVNGMNIAKISYTRFD